MNPGYATILEIQQNMNGTRQAVIHWPGGKTPLPGQYLQAFNPAEPDIPAAMSIFPGGLPDPDLPSDIWTTAPSIPLSWSPADQLLLRGPLGNGFTILEGPIRIALASFGEYSAYLLPIAGKILASKGEVALYTDSPFPQMPTSIEVNPLSSLGDGIRWADFLAGCTALERLPETRSILRKTGTLPISEVLILSPMPCGALAACGVCATRSAEGKIILICEEGPVIPWQKL